MKKQLIKEAVFNNILNKLGFNTVVKFSNDPEIYYVKNVSIDKNYVFVTKSTGLGTWKKSINKITHINNKPITEHLSKQEIIRKSYSILHPLLNEEVENISKSEAKDILSNSKGKVFTVKFVKKDGSTRTMNARTDVKKYLKGGELPYDPKLKKLLPVYDLKVKDYRMINLNTIFYIKMNNIEYSVK